MHPAHAASTKHHGRVLPLALLAGLAVTLAIRLIDQQGLVDEFTPGPVAVDNSPWVHLEGKPAPRLELAGLDGQPVSTRYAEGPQLLVFTDTNCRACERTYRDLRDFAPPIRTVIIGKGEQDKLAAAVDAYGLTYQVAFDGARTMGEHGIDLTPTILLVDRGMAVRYAGTSVELALARLSTLRR